MKTPRSFRRSLVSLLIIAFAMVSVGGCGGTQDKTVVAVEPEFQKKTSDMLKQMRTDAMEKSKKLVGRKR